MKQTTNPDSVYADDDAEALGVATYEEQRGRWAAIVVLEKALEGSLSLRKADELRKELRALQEIYRGQWVELESALGPAVAAEVRERAEADAGQGINDSTGRFRQLGLRF